MSEQVLEVEELSEDDLNDDIPCQINVYFGGQKHKCGAPASYRVKNLCCPPYETHFCCFRCLEWLRAGRQVLCRQCGQFLGEKWRMI